MTMNVAAKYNDNKIMTASPAELTLMLYEGAIKFCNIAIMAIEKNDLQKANHNIIKAESIISELRSTLDEDYPVSKDLDLLYEYIYRRLIEANLDKDKAIIEEVLDFIGSLETHGKKQ